MIVPAPWMRLARPISSNLVPLRAALDYWRKLTVEQVQAHNGALVDALIEGLDREPV